MNRHFSLMFLFLFPLFTMGQELVKISGTVMDASTKEGITLASVLVRDHSSRQLVTGTYTDQQGRFELNISDTSIVDITIAFLGYDKLVIEKMATTESINLGDLNLEQNEEVLNEVVIEGAKDQEFVEMKIDRKVYNIDQMQILEGSTTTEALQIIPSVEVDIDGNISLRGSENLIVLMDGKPTGLSGDDLTAFLESMPASMMQNVEVISNPSAKYDPDGMAGIINLVSKTNKLQGFSGNINVNAGTSGFYTASAMLAIKKGKWNVMANMSYNYRNSFSEGATERESTDGDTVTYLSQTTNGDHIREMAMARINATYTINDKNSLSLSGMLSYRNMNRNQLNYYEFENSEHDITSIYDRLTDGGGTMLPTNVSLDYRKKFKKEGQSWSLGAALANFSGDFRSEFEETLYSSELVRLDEANLKQRQHTIPNNNTLTLQTDYSHPVGENALFETGLKSITKVGGSDFVSEVYDFESSEWVNESQLTNDFLLDEGINSAYGTIKQQFKKFGYQVGLRAEQAFTDAQLLSTDESFYNEYFSLFPTLHMSYWLPKRQQLKASYSRRLNRPRGRMLNPFTDFSDPQNIRKGNPFLLPEYINSYEIEYQRFWNRHTLTAALYHKEINGMITRVKEVSEGISVVSYENLGSGTNTGVEFSWNMKPAKWWNFTLSGNTYQTIIESDESELNASGYAYHSKLLSSFTLPKDYSVQVQANYSSPKILAQGEISAMYFGDFSIKKKVLKKKGSVSLKLTDVLNTREYNFITEGINFYQESYRKRQSRILWLGFSYNFGQYTERGNRSGGKGSDLEEIEID